MKGYDDISIEIEVDREDEEIYEKYERARRRVAAFAIRELTAALAPYFAEVLVTVSDYDDD